MNNTAPTKEEMLAVGRRLKPELTDEQFELMWDEFQRITNLKEPQ